MENRENENAIVQLEKNASKEYLVGVGNEEELKDPTPRAEPMESNEIEQVPESDCVFNEGQVEVDQETEPVYLDKDAKKKKSHRVIYMIEVYKRQGYEWKPYYPERYACGCSNPCLRE